MVVGSWLGSDAPTDFLPDNPSSFQFWTPLRKLLQDVSQITWDNFFFKLGFKKTAPQG